MKNDFVIMIESSKIIVCDVIQQELNADLVRGGCERRDLLHHQIGSHRWSDICYCLAVIIIKGVIGE